VASLTTDPLTDVRERSPLREVGRFILYAFAGAWAAGGIGYFLLDLGQVGLGVGVLMVAVAALVCTRRDEGSARSLVERVTRWRIDGRWYGAALLIPFLALAAVWLLAPIAADPVARSEVPGPSLLLLFPVYVLLFGGPEELGWRGYALPRLQARFSALTSSAVLAALWMAWHAPLFLMPDAPGFSEVPVAAYLVIGTASCVVYTWLYNSTRGSILAAVLLHASKNLSLAWLLLPIDYALYAGTWVVLALGLVLAYGPKDLSRLPRHRIGPTARTDRSTARWA
jgi:uncharacterized protein